MGGTYSNPHTQIILPELERDTFQNVSQRKDNYGTFAKWLMNPSIAENIVAFGNDGEFTYIIIDSPIVTTKQSNHDPNKEVKTTYDTPIGFRWKPYPITDYYQVLVTKVCETDRYNLCTEHKCKLDKCPKPIPNSMWIQGDPNRGGKWESVNFNQVAKMIQGIINNYITTQQFIKGEANVRIGTIA